MTDILDKIDASLEEVEEQLLIELNRVRTSSESDPHRQVDTGIRNALHEIVTDLHQQLQNSGDRMNLQLITKRHEVLFSRIGVLQQLLSEPIPARLLTKAHDGVEARRRLLERRVFEKREAEAPKTPPKKTGLLRGLFDHSPSRQEIERNRYHVTRQEADQLESHQDYLDNGIYSASRELAMLASLLRGGSLDTPPEEGPDKGRAVFRARELSNRIPIANKRSRMTREPVQNETSARSGKTDRPATSDKRDIAQTPEEIRRKLEARRHQDGAGKAVFASRDVSQSAPQEQTSAGPKTEPETPPTSGKAIFASKDIEPAMPQQFYGRKRQDEDDEKSKEEDKPRTGRATFEARDLSENPFSKKD